MPRSPEARLGAMVHALCFDVLLPHLQSAQSMRRDLESAKEKHAKVRMLVGGACFE